MIHGQLASSKQLFVSNKGEQGEIFWRLSDDIVNETV